MKKFIVSAIVGGLFISPVHAEPSYDKTVSFILEKVLTFDDFSSTYVSKFEGGYSYKLSEISKCVFVRSRRGKGWYFNIDETVKVNQLSEHRFNLKDFDPTRSDVIENNGLTFVRLITIDDKKSVSVSFKKYIRNEEEKYLNTSVDIEVKEPTHRNAPKMLKALNHLIKLCGGKGELF